jgi:hypothetical protein
MAQPTEAELGGALAYAVGKLEGQEIDPGHASEVLDRWRTSKARADDLSDTQRDLVAQALGGAADADDENGEEIEKAAEILGVELPPAK